MVKGARLPGAARIMRKSESADTTTRPSSSARARNFLVLGGVHSVGPHMNRIVPGSREKLGQARLQDIVDQKSQADCGSSRSMAAAAVNRRHSRISCWRSGYSERISVSVRPPASSRCTVATGIRRCRTHGTPPICAGSTVMRSKFFITCFSIIVATAESH
jgi:hypothetical protein